METDHCDLLAAIRQTHPYASCCLLNAGDSYPDLFITFDGVMLFFYLTDGKPLTHEQLSVYTDLEDNGLNMFVAREGFHVLDIMVGWMENMYDD